MTLHRRCAVALAASLAAVIAMVVLAPSAFAHAAFLEATPAPGSRLEASPREIGLKFSEPLDRGLSTVFVEEAASGRRVAAMPAAGTGPRLGIRPASPLPSGAYRVRWHTVSTEDGHALEGSFGFGVRAAAAGLEQRVEQSPLARGGWVRIALRAVFYSALVFFGGGLFAAVLLGSRGEPAGWLTPRAVRAALEEAGLDPEGPPARAWRWTVGVGWAAAALAACVAVAEAVDAAGGLSAQAASSFLLSNAAGLGRVLTVMALALAAALAARGRIALAAAACALAFLAIALSGHANSATPRAAAVASDWVHLLAGSLWLGGVAQLAAAWVPSLRRGAPELRRAIIGGVLERFGAVALPAFLVVVLSGVINALIQLGRPEALWGSAYGRLLALKALLVVLIGLASYWHAARLRPRILAARSHPGERLERRHRRLIHSEPLLAVGVVALAATLVAFPLPPRQLAEASDAPAAVPPCDPCAQPAPRGDELAVAEQAGPSIAAAWLRRDGDQLTGRLRILDRDAKPVGAAVSVTGAEMRACGRGCLDFRLRGKSPTLRVAVRQGARSFEVLLPAQWRARESARARRLLIGAQRRMRALRSVTEREVVTSGPGSFASATYRLRAPDRLAYVSNLGSEVVEIGRREWFRAPGLPWRRRPAQGTLPFRTRSWFRWSAYARVVRLLGVRRAGGRRIAELALMEEGTPAWHRLEVDLATMRVLRVRVITGGHFITQRFSAFDVPTRIDPPEASDGS